MHSIYLETVLILLFQPQLGTFACVIIALPDHPLPLILHIAIAEDIGGVDIPAELLPLLIVLAQHFDFAVSLEVFDHAVGLPLNEPVVLQW